MKIFLDIETLLHNISLEKKISKLIRNSQRLKSLPYNSQLIGLMENNYKDSSIVILSPEIYEDECKRACEDLQYFNKGNWCVNYLCYRSQEEKLRVIENESLYIGNSITDKALKKTKYSALISNVFSCAYYLITSKNRSHVVSTGLNGAISILFSYMAFILPIMILWPAFFEIKSYIIDQKALEYSIYATMNTFFFSSLVRSVTELDVERKEYMKGFVPLCGKPFIYKPNSLKIAIFYMFLSIVLSIFLFFRNRWSIVPTLVMGIANFCSLLMPKTARYLIIAASMVLTQIICQWKFISFFAKSVF